MKKQEGDLKMFYIKIPAERIGVLIGREGKLKDEIEKKTGAKIEIDSETGDVTIDDKNIKEPIYALKTVDFVKAIGRGFSPHRAYRLLDNEDIYFEAIDIRDFVGRRKGHVRRMRSRLIGTRGKARRTIEELSGADISVYGNTVSIIGDYFQLELARTAVTMLLRGSEHSTVYRFLEKRKKAEELEELTA